MRTKYVSRAGSPFPTEQLVPIPLANQAAALFHHRGAMPFEVSIDTANQGLKESHEICTRRFRQMTFAMVRTASSSVAPMGINS